VSEYVKFTHKRVSADTLPFNQLSELNDCRRKLRELHLIGIDSNGISFGNLSVRDGATRNFYISGSATGGLAKLTLADCVRVVAYDFEQNSVRYEGVAIPSSESLTHAAIYESDPTASAVIHCHDSVLWVTLLNQVPTTSQTSAYGTAEISYEIVHLFDVSDARSRKIFVMGGHKDGIMAFGEKLKDAFDTLTRARSSILS
jgi:ribulose-5-phosphate 4-epimerase/fuculose-1-phosphate aldolase